MRVSEDGGATVGLEVMGRIRRDIVDGKLAPGAKLKFADLREAYGAGIGTLREALSGLVAEGIVTLDAGRGFRVAEISEEDLIDLMAMRVEIERRAIEDSVRSGGENWEERVLTSFHRLSKVSHLPFPDRYKPDTDWIARHKDFHDALVSACRSPRTLQFRAILYGQAERYRFLSIAHGPRLQDGEHEQMRDACLARDATLAGDLLVKHIVDSAEFVLKYSPQLGRKAAAE